MKAAHDQFTRNFKHIREIDALYKFLQDTLLLSTDLSDLLRAQIVYSVSALDALIHEFIRIGMLLQFQGKRNTTEKFKSFTITTHSILNIQASIATSPATISLPPPEYYYELEIVMKNRNNAFQDPEKISDGLSLIWNEKHKWQVIAAQIGSDEQTIKQTLRNIVLRRNQIVHEADNDIQTGLKNKIDYNDVQISTSFIETLGAGLYEVLK